MSLIDDALKRAQAAGEGERSRPGDRPWSPTPMPDAGLARRRTVIRAMGIALAAGILAGTGLWLVRREFAPDANHPLPAGAGRGEGRSLAAVVSPTPFPIVVVQPPPGSAPAAATPAIQARTTRAPSTAREGQGAAAPATARAEAAPAPAAHSQAITDGKIYAGAVTLADGAKIELGGIVWSETEPRALLNDRITGVGGYVEGFTVARIEQDRVELEKDGVTIYVSVK